MRSIRSLRWVCMGVLSGSALGQPLLFMEPRGGVGNEITVTAPATVTIDVFVQDVAPTLLGAYQVTLPMTAAPVGTTAGSVVHDGVPPVIDTARADFVFLGLSNLIANGFINNGNPGMVALFFPPPPEGFPLVTQRKYLGELTYVVSSGSVGLFSIDFVNPGTDNNSETVLTDPNQIGIPFTLNNVLIRARCLGDADCDDGLFCNGAETCVADACVAGTPPCPQPGLPLCDDTLDMCVECLLNTDCDDANECTANVCNAGVCTFPPEAPGTACGDPSNTQCTNPDTCDGAGNCQNNHELNGTACDDMLFCNAGEACQNGVCTGGSFTCEDGISCTTDSCDEALDQCFNVLQAGFCLIGGACFNDGQLNPANECESCDTALSTSTWSTKPDGTTCNSDGNDCTDDICGAGACTHPNLAVNTPCGNIADTDCDNPDTCDGAGTCLVNHEPDLLACTSDGNDCTDDLCNAGVCTHPNLPSGTSCGDGSATQCTAPDTCNGLGFCLSNNQPNGTPCDDGLFCNVNEACSIGVCQGGHDRNCNDGLSCTTDSCNEVLDQCDNLLQMNKCLIGQACFNDGQLNPGNECENCDSAVSSNMWTARPDGTVCTDDGNDCTNDACSAGSCSHPNLAVNTPCGNPSDTDCDNPDTCDGAGLCLANHEPDLLACPDDANDCTADHCLTGVCAHPNLPVGTPCANQQDSQCDHPDTCNGAGQCLQNLEPDGTSCDDADACTEPDECSAGVCLGPFIPAPLMESTGMFSLRVTPRSNVGPSSVLQALHLTSTTQPCVAKFVDVDGTLTDTPVFQTAQDWGIVDVSDFEIIPLSFYTVRAECGGQGTPSAGATTSPWTDLVVDGAVDIFDLFCVLRVFANDFSLCSFETADLNPCGGDGNVDIFDLFQVLNAFAGQTYPCAGPCADGACCDTVTGACMIATDPACQAAGGVFQGVGTNCLPNPCP